MDPAAHAYLASVRAALAFDPPLADRVAAEVADHLAETPDPAAALAGFGPPEVLARDCAAAHGPARLAAFLKLLLTALLLVVLTMRLRLAFLPPVVAEGWLLPARLLDRYGLAAALIAAALAGIGLWRQRRGRGAGRHLPPARLAAAGAVALLLSSLGGGVLTLAGVAAADDWGGLPPLATTLAEAAALAILGAEYRRLRHYPGLAVRPA